MLNKHSLFITPKRVYKHLKTEKMNDIISQIDQKQKQIEAFGKFDAEVQKRINYKFRLDWNYYSNSMEGNSLTRVETRQVMMDNVTIQGKPFKDIAEMRGHDKEVLEIIKMGKGEVRISEARIKQMHKAIMHEDDSQKINLIGKWKESNNYIINYKGEKIQFLPFTEVPEAMHSLLNKTNAAIDNWGKKSKDQIHPTLLAFQFHLEYVKIHPFYDGNGRTGRLLMNLLLISSGYPPVILKEKDREPYYKYLADIQGYGANPDLFYRFMGELVVSSQQLILDALAGKDIEDEDDLDKEIEMLKHMQNPPVKKIEKSKAVVKQVLTEVYFPLLEELNNKLSKFNKLFEEHSWTYFEEPTPPNYSTPVVPKFSSLEQMIAYFYYIPDKLGESVHDFKASYWLMKYNDQRDFSMEVALKIHFSEFEYRLEIFIGQPFQSSEMVKMFTEILSTLTKEKKPFSEFEKIDLPVKLYGVVVLPEEIKDWSNNISKKTLEVLKLKAIGK